MSFNEQKIQRRKWTDEEKKNTLTSCSSKCARCGKKLTLKTLTMDHVVPISKGGENILDNLVALCQTCNSRKANKFCWPKGYYMALMNTNKLHRVDEYARRWVSLNITNDNLIEYPLIAECTSCKVDIGVDSSKIFVPQFIKDIVELNHETIKQYMRALGFTKEDFLHTVPNSEQLYSVYGVKSYDGETVYSVYTVQYINNIIFISEVTSTNGITSKIVPLAVLNSFCEVYQFYNVDTIVVRTQNTNTANFIFESFRRDVATTRVYGGYNKGTAVLIDGVEPWFNPDNIFAFKIYDKVQESIIDAKKSISSKLD